MRRDDTATTDTIALLPLLTCCVVATMVVFSTISLTGDAFMDARSLDHLRTTAKCLLEEVMRLIAERGDDGLRYLDPAWRELLPSLEECTSMSKVSAAVLTVDVMGMDSVRTAIRGEIEEDSLCCSSVSFALYVSEGRCLPSIIMMSVGI